MACSISKIQINRIDPPVGPSLLRVLGEAIGCLGNQVQLTSSIAAASGPVNVDPTTGRFKIEVPITATPTPPCGSTIQQIRVECVQQPTSCYWETFGTTVLECCQKPTFFWNAYAALNALAPTEMVVRGAIYGCYNDQVTVSATFPSSSITVGPVTVQADQYTGAFTAQFTLPAGINCDDEVSVTASCASIAGCSDQKKGKLTCTNCYRAAVTLSAGQCSGSPPTQPVTFNTTINLNAGQTQQFQWDFGDGIWGTPFTINNTTGTATTSYTNSATHQYAPGTYTATLRMVPPSECELTSVTVTVQCAPNCPTVTVSPPQVATTCVNGKRQVTLTAQVTAVTGQTTVVEWDFGDGTQGGAAVIPSGGPQTHTKQHDYSPGTYTASLNTIAPTGCPPQTVTFTVDPCEEPPCTLVVNSVSFTVGNCNPNGTRTVQATANLNSAGTADDYWWTWYPSQSAQGPITTAQGGGTQSHDYAAPGPNPTVYPITVVVKRGNCVATGTASVTVQPCQGACPSITAITDNAPGVCTADQMHRSVQLNATIVGTGVTQYEWDFGDGSAKQTIPGTSGPQTSHDYSAGTYTVRLTATGPGNCTTFLDKQITVTACCPQVTGITVSPGTCGAGATTRPVSLGANVSGSGFTSFDWNFGDGATVTTTQPFTPPHNYTAPGTFTATVTAHAPGCPDSVATATVNVAACPPVTNGGGGGGTPACAFLLWLSIILMLIGAILFLVGCVLEHFLPQPGFIMMVVGAIIFVLGWLLFLIWLIFCSALTACSVILAVRDFILFLIFLFGIIAVILTIVAIIDKSYALCAGAAWALGFNWGLILAILDLVAQARGCLIKNPSGGSPSSASSSSGLGSSGSSMRARSNPGSSNPGPASSQDDDCGCH